MWRRKHEYLMAELLDHPALGVMMTSAGIERRALELLLEANRQIREPAWGGSHNDRNRETTGAVGEL